MAFGHPGKVAALTYLATITAGVALGFSADPLWLRALGFVAACYAVFCFFISGAWTALPTFRAKNVEAKDKS